MPYIITNRKDVYFSVCDFYGIMELGLGRECKSDLSNKIQVFDLNELFSRWSNMSNEILTLSVLRLICSANLQL